MRCLKKKILDGMIVLVSCILLVCLVQLGVYYYKGFRYNKAMGEIVDTIRGGIATPYTPAPTRPAQTEVSQPMTAPAADPTQDTPQQPQFSRELSAKWKDQLATLTSQNADCVGFLEIPDTKIAFPVMFTPNNPQYYLYRNFKKQKESRGTPFLDGATVLGESANYIVYGHNMKDGSVFGTLKNYLNDAKYVEAHKYIFFNTPFSEGVYEVFAVCWIVVDTGKDAFRYDEYGGNLTRDQFEMYVSQIRAASAYQSEVEVSWWDQLLTLSTCLHDRSASDYGRLIVVAKRVK